MQITPSWKGRHFYEKTSGKMRQILNKSTERARQWYDRYLYMRGSKKKLSEPQKESEQKS